MTLPTIRNSLVSLLVLALSTTFTSAQIGTDTSSPAETDLNNSASGSPSDDGFNTTDSSNNDNDSDHTRDTVGLVNYYFVFLALVVCIAGVAAYLMYKRKQKYGAFLRNSRGSALERDVGSYDARARRRYWAGRWRSTDDSREEGLNEYGEAPPPYMPKTREEEANPNHLAVPMQALSRDEAGLNKPPDYDPADMRPAGGQAHQSGAGASTPSQPEQSHTNHRFA